MRVRDVLAGLEDVDPESDCRVWSDGMRIMTTRYGTPVEREEPAMSLRRRFEVTSTESRAGSLVATTHTLTEKSPFEEEPMPKVSIGYRRRIEVKPKWKLPEVVYLQSFSGARGLTKVVHYFDHQASTLIFCADTEGFRTRDTATMAKTWCGIYGDPLSFNDSIGPEMRLCLTCQRIFDEWHTACESCGVITHNDEMHTLGGDRDGEAGPEAVPPECDRCYRERERIEAPYRTVMSA